MSSVSLPSYLLLTPKGFFFRLRVPKRFQAKLGKRELKKAIAGTDRRLAERQAILYAAEAFALFNSLEDATLSPYSQKMVVISGRHDTKFILDKNNTEKELQMLIDRGLIPQAQPLSVVPTPEAPIQALSTASISEPEGICAATLLSKAVDVYIDELKDKKKGKFTEPIENELKSKLELLITAIGDKPIGKINYYDAKKYRTILTELPRSRMSAAYKDMTLDELRADSAVKCGPNTVNQRLQTISSMFLWFTKVDHTLSNPFQGMSIDDDESAIKKKLPFNSDDLSKLFADHIWTKKKINHTWEYWAPLILLYTGARITEVLQLAKDDFIEIDGIWCMSVNDKPTREEPEEVWPWKKHLKNKNSMRDIPIHPHLHAKGLRKFVESLPQGRLFPNIKPVAGKLAKYPCQRFNEHILPRTGVKVTTKKTFYSFRHTTLNALKQQGVHSEERAQLAGHAAAKDNMSELVYGEGYNITLMQALVGKLDFSEAIKSVQPW